MRYIAAEQSALVLSLDFTSFAPHSPLFSK